MLKQIGTMGLLWMLTACQSLSAIHTLPPLTQPLTLQVVTEDKGNWQNSLLIIQPQAQQQWRFIQLDALGSPLARQILAKGRWHNDGFLPPNHQAQLLFSAVYAYLAQKNHWSLPADLQAVQITQDKRDQHITQIQWQQHRWQIKELTNE